MKRILAVIAVAVAAATAPADAASTYTVDRGHSDVSFQVRHFVTKVRGNFGDFSGTIVKDDADPSKSSVEFRVAAASIDTRHADRDKHLRAEDFLWAEKHPELTFESTAVERLGETELRVTGDLTVRGVTRQISFTASLDGEMKDPWGNTKAGFSATFRISRKEFGIVWNKALDNGGFMLSDEVDVFVNLEAKKG